MKKSFYFALALTAGLFASCSSDDLTADSPQQNGLEINDAERVPIQIGVANAGATASLTRGTGTVGQVDLIDAMASKWLGQSFQLYMFNKGTLTPGSSDGTEDGVVFCDSTFTTKKDGTGKTQMLVNGKDFQAYYPAAGSFDFWAYRLDDAKTASVTSPITGVATYDATADEWTDNAAEVKVPFVIDGTQDVMVGAVKATQITADVATLKTKVASLTDATAEEKLYSAYSARRGVNPALSFQHLLTRLHFAVKAGAKKVSSSDDTYGAVGAGGDNSIPDADHNGFTGFRVDSICVYSMSEGQLIAAYKATSDYAPGNAKEGQKIEWTSATEDWSDYTTLKPMYLKEFSKSVTNPQEGKFEQIAKFGIPASGLKADITYSGNTIKVNTTGTSTSTLSANGNETTLLIYADDEINKVTGIPSHYLGTLKEVAEKFFDSVDTDEDGELSAAELSAANITLPYESTAQYTYYKTALIAEGATEDVTSPLKTLTGQQLLWGNKDAYYWEMSTKAAYTAAAATDQVQTPVTTPDFNKAITGLTAAAAGDMGKVHLLYIDVDNSTDFDKDKDVLVGYVKGAQITADDGAAITRPIGDALFVAPSTSSDGYTIQIKYSRWRLEGAKLKWASQVQTSTIKSGYDFVAGNSHLVTITINQDSTPSVEVKDEGWNEDAGYSIDD